MTTQEYMDLYDRYWKNKEGLGFYISIKSVNGEMSIKIENIDEKYKNALKKIINPIMKGGIYLAVHNTKPESLATKDEKNFMEKWEENIYKKKAYFMDILLNLGMNQFLEQVCMEQARFEMAYQLMNIFPEVKKNDENVDKVIYRSSNGATYKDGKWEKNNVAFPLFEQTLNWNKILL